MRAGIQHFWGVGRRLPHFFESKCDSLAEWSKALASGASPQGRGLEPTSYHRPDLYDVCIQNARKAITPSFKPPTRTQTPSCNRQIALNPLLQPPTKPQTLRCNPSRPAPNQPPNTPQTSFQTPPNDSQTAPRCSRKRMVPQTNGWRAE